MKPETVEPIETPDAHEHFGVQITHPAYAYVQANRISGQQFLLGSDFSHQHFVRLRIGKASMRRNLSSDWHYPQAGSYIEVDMSESQWAQFVSSMNAQSTPCTLQSRDNEPVPQLPRPKNRVDQFASEARKTMDRGMEEIRDAKEAVAASGLSAKAKQEIQRKLDHALMSVSSSVKFVADQFGEHMETQVERAKTEVNAYVGQALTRAGLEHLGGVAPILQIENDHDD